VVLVAAAGFGGYALGRRHEAAQRPAANTVSAAFVHFQLAGGWKVVAQTSTEVSLRSDPDGYITVQAGNSRQEGVTTDAGLLEQALYGVTQDHLKGSVGSCLPVTPVDIGGKQGEEVGFLFREIGLDGTTVFENCELAWADVQGSRFYFWDAFQPVSRLPQLVSATRAMERSVVWTR
jgi:hypothetical protein